MLTLLTEHFCLSLLTCSKYIESSQLLKGDVHSHWTGEFNAILLPSPQMHPHMPHALPSYCRNYYTNATMGTTTCTTAKISSVI